MTIFARRTDRYMWILVPFFLFYILLSFWASGNFFFWDTIQLGAKHALFFYDTNFTQLFLPDEFDSGHIPAFGMYLALCWKIFGKSLFVSHLAMLPFLLGIVYQSMHLLKKYIHKKYLHIALIIFLADATLLSQSILVTPDIPLVFFFLLGLNAVLVNRRNLIMLAGIGLVLTSMRGMMVTFALGLIDLSMSFRFFNFNFKKTTLILIKKIPAYLSALVIIVVFNYLHLKYKGWFGYHQDSPWANSFHMVDIRGVIYNIGILIWRLIDFGRVFMFLAALFILAANLKSLKKDEKVTRLISFFIIILVCLSISFVLYKHLSGHRYLLPVFLSFSLLVIYLIFEKLKNEKLKYSVSVVLILGLLSGNLWVYPTNIAQGWDASLAHVPYYSLRIDMLEYLKQENIPVEDVACTFPNDSEFRYMDLNNSKLKHQKLNLDENQFVLFSNVYNDFSDEEVSRLESGSEFILLKEFTHCNVFLRLYQRK